MNGDEFLRDITPYRRIVEVVRSLGFIGATVGVLYGLVILVWCFLPKSVVEGPLSGRAHIGMFVIVTGIAGLLNQSRFRMMCLLKSISRAEKTALISTSLANGARLAVVSRTVGQDVEMIDQYFRSFVAFLRQKNDLPHDAINKVERRWRSFRERAVTPQGKPPR